MADTTAELIVQDSRVVSDATVRAQDIRDDTLRLPLRVKDALGEFPQYRIELHTPGVTTTFEAERTSPRILTGIRWPVEVAAGEQIIVSVGRGGGRVRVDLAQPQR